jgi:hypothetical protein
LIISGVVQGNVSENQASSLHLIIILQQMKIEETSLPPINYLEERLPLTLCKKQLTAFGGSGHFSQTVPQLAFTLMMEV